MKKAKYKIGETIYHYSDMSNKIEQLKIESDNDIDYTEYSSDRNYFYKFENIGGIHEKLVTTSIKEVLKIANKILDEEIESIKNLKKDLERETIEKYKKEYNIELRIDKLERVTKDMQRYFYFSGVAYQDIMIDGEKDVYDEHFEKIIESKNKRKAKEQLVGMFKKDGFDKIKIEDSYETDGFTGEYVVSAKNIIDMLIDLKALNEPTTETDTSKANLNIPDVSGCSAIHFGRFLMKYCTVKYDKEGYLVYEYEGAEYNTDELYKLFCNNR